MTMTKTSTRAAARPGVSSSTATGTVACPTAWPLVPRAELLLGGQKSGKSRAAESRAAAWLARPGRAATLVATAIAGDDEMAARIARHRADRAARVPGLRTHEASQGLAEAIASLSAPGRLVVVDCLTLWLAQIAMPPSGRVPSPPAGSLEAACGSLVAAVRRARGPVVLVSNEIGLGVVPMSAEARAVVDALGRLHQDLATVCDRVTLLVAGCEMRVKDAVDAGAAADVDVEVEVEVEVEVDAAASVPEPAPGVAP